MKKCILNIVLVLAVFASCQKENIGVMGSEVICFDFSLPQTKATATSFEVDDAVSLFAVEYSSEDAPEVQIAGNFLNNEELTFNGSEWSADKTLYWSTKPCDFYALYPYTNLTSVEEFPFEVAIDQNSSKTQLSLGGYEASDLLWAKAENVSQSQGVVNLQFKHMMSKCVVTLTKGDKFEGEIPDDVVCHIYNTVTSAKLNFAEGTVEKETMGERKTITMKKVSRERFEAILVPQHIENRTPLIEVTMGGIAYLLEYTMSFKPSYAHTINLILNTSPDQEKIEISIDAGTGDWSN